MAIIEDLVVTEYGSFVGLKGRRLQVRVPDAEVVQAPLLHLRTVQIHTRSASLSASAIHACCQEGIPIYFVDMVEGNYGSLFSPNLTTVNVTRRAQIAALETLTGVDIAKRIFIGKLQSQITNLRYLSRRLDSSQSFQETIILLKETIDRIADLRGNQLDEIREQMMGMEGNCAKSYWEMLRTLVPEKYGWEGRKGRHATDPVNSLLNYGYGILYGEVQNALVIAGLEPYVGLVHVDRPGKPSLTLDLIEEFRAPIVDRTVIGLVSRNFEVKQDDNGRMNRNTRKQFAEHILSRLKAQATVNKKRYQLRSVLQMQARLLASAFRGEAVYTAYTRG